MVKINHVTCEHCVHPLSVSVWNPRFSWILESDENHVFQKSYRIVVTGSQGTFSSDNKTLLTDILREEWGFDGIVVTDWGAMNDRIRAFEAGCDLEMPSSNGIFDEEVKKSR
ncbi:MAG: glycoside hydrolase family 3 N-terminal domain-containing protein [Oliverpabstia sp.]